MKRPRKGNRKGQEHGFGKTKKDTEMYKKGLGEIVTTYKIWKQDK